MTSHGDWLRYPTLGLRDVRKTTRVRKITVELKYLLSIAPKHSRSKRQRFSGDTLAAAANFLALRPIAALAMRHWTGSTRSEPLVSVPGAAVPQRDCRRDESARADHIED